MDTPVRDQGAPAGSSRVGAAPITAASSAAAREAAAHWHAQPHARPHARPHVAGAGFAQRVPRRRPSILEHLFDPRPSGERA